MMEINSVHGKFDRLIENHNQPPARHKLETNIDVINKSNVFLCFNVVLNLSYPFSSFRSPHMVVPGDRYEVLLSGNFVEN